MFGAGQAFEYLISKFYSHDLSEAQALGAAIHGELNQLIPSFVKRAQRNDYLVATTAAAKALAAHATASTPVATNEPVTLVDYDADAEAKVLAAILYGQARQPLEQLRKIAAALSQAERQQIFQEYFAKRRHRRDKLSRAFENVYYTFDILGNLGSLPRSASSPDSHPGAPEFYHGARLRHPAGDRRGQASRASSTVV